MKKLVVFLALFCFAQNLSAEQFYVPPDSCLMMYWDNDYDHNTNTGSYNPDSIMVDKCAPDFKLPTYQIDTNTVFYAKKGYYLRFKPNYYPFPNVLKNGEYATSNDIIFPTVKAFFINLENELGGQIEFRHSRDDESLSDSVRRINNSFRPVFPKYVEAKKLEQYIQSFMSENDTIKYFFFTNRMKILAGIPNDNFMNSDIIYPNPATDFLNLNENISNNNIEILNTLGEEIINIPYTDRINVSALSSGIYFIKINNQFYKFIKK